MAFTAILLLVSTIAFGQNYETSKTLNKNASVPADVLIDMKNNTGDLKIVVGTNDNVTLKTSVYFTTKTEADGKKLLEALDDFDFELHGDRLEINTRFYTNMRTINGKTTMVLVQGGKIKLQDFSIEHELSIPANARLQLENKYSNVTIPTMANECKLTLYSSKLDAGDFKNVVTINAKYSKLYVDNFTANLELELYDTDLEFDAAKNVEINSKYSKIEGDKAENLTIESYDDNFDIDEIGSVKMNAKYSNLESDARLKLLELELYDCDIKVESAENLTYYGKYSGLELGDVKNVKIDDCYDSDISFGVTGSIEIGVSKYSSFEVEENQQFSIDDSYDDDFIIKKLDSGFSGFSLNGKYSKIQIDTDAKDVKVDVAMKYGKVDLPKSVNIAKHIDKNNQLEIEGGDKGGTIAIQGYDNTVIIR